MKVEKRLENLDYLRGVAAFGIMIYHYLYWSIGTFTSETVMGRIGVYGVSLFYILSGLTLFHVYYTKMSPSIPELKNFYIKRLFRIFPLLWLVIAATLILNKQLPDPIILALNVTGLFGIFKWNSYIGTGVWSIGNELVFYLFFPIFIFLSNYYKSLFMILSALLLAIYLWFAYGILDPQHALSDQWSFYVNPLNQVFLFLGGFLIGLFCSKYSSTPLLNTSILVFSVLVFVFFPVEGNTIHLVTGHHRVLFTILCFLICFSFYKSTYRLPGIFHTSLTLLGEASYSVYLIHPIVWFSSAVAFKLLAQNLFNTPYPLRVLFCVILTLFISHLIYGKYEKYFMKKGRELSSRVAG
jgi:exopolysaccharide production protein ExoZ